MNSERQLAQTLEQTGSALAGYAAQELFAHLDREGASSGVGFRWWKSFLESRLSDLAAAVNLGQPRLFVAQVRWCRVSTEARGVANDEMKLALTALRQTLATELGDAGPAVAQNYLDAAIADFGEQIDLPESLLDINDPHGRLAAQYVLAILEGNRQEASRRMAAAVDEGLNVRTAYLEVLTPAAREIGRMWHVDELSIAEEHFASDTTQMVMAQLQARAPIAPPNGKTLLAASVAGNRHDLGTRMVANFFEMDGWQVVCLGGDSPGSDVAQAVIDFKADLLLLSAAIPTQLHSVERTIEFVRRRSHERSVHIMVGGIGFDLSSHSADRFGADGYAQSAAEAVAAGRQLVGLPPAAEAPGSV